MAKMDPAIQKKIIALCEHGAKLAEMKEFAFALSKYYDALALVPDPKKDYKATTWIYSSMGELHWKKRDYNEAGRAFLQAYRSVGGEQSADVNFRLGQCLVECGEPSLAHQYLCQAYMLDGESLFATEDPKYFEVIRSEIYGPEPTAADDDGDEDECDYDVLSQLVRDSDSEPIVVDEGPDSYNEDVYAVRSRGRRFVPLEQPDDIDEDFDDLDDYEQPERISFWGVIKSFLDKFR